MDIIEIRTQGKWRIEGDGISAKVEDGSMEQVSRALAVLASDAPDLLADGVDAEELQKELLAADT